MSTQVGQSLGPSRRPRDDILIKLISALIKLISAAGYPVSRSGF
jgi:hypothetical protein